VFTQTHYYDAFREWRIILNRGLHRSVRVCLGCQLLVYPGAFNMTTGPAHWELLARARAIDNQCYVATVSPARDVTAEYVAWGHSLVVNPWYVHHTADIHTFCQLSLPSLQGRSIEYRPVWLGLRRGAFTCVRWQVTLCDPIWQVTLRSSWWVSNP